MRTIIGLDVSKATAELSVATDSTLVYNGEITLDIISFNNLRTIVSLYGEVEIVFEATGV